MQQKIPMTVHGAEKLRQELHHLKSVMRPQIIKNISEARAHGDLKENAEYHAAKEQQGFVEGRIRDLEGKLSHAHIIDVRSLPQTGKVVFGATVTMVNTETDETVTYQIVGEDEADIKEAKISHTSPIARAMISKKTGDILNVNTPAGSVEYEIMDVVY